MWVSTCGETHAEWPLLSPVPGSHFASAAKETGWSSSADRFDAPFAGMLRLGHALEVHCVCSVTALREIGGNMNRRASHASEAAALQVRDSTADIFQQNKKLTAVTSSLRFVRSTTLKLRLVLCDRLDGSFGATLLLGFGQGAGRWCLQTGAGLGWQFEPP